MSPRVWGSHGAGVEIRLCEVSFSSKTYGDLDLPTVNVATDHPAISALASQFAGWKIKVREYFGMGSGPARALALKPKEIYDEIEYKDEADSAIIVLESDTLPPDDATDHIASEYEVRPSKVYALVTRTNSVAGAVQISGRVAETGIYKLRRLGLDPRKIIYAFGSAPIPTIRPESARAMGRTNYALYHGGETCYTVNFEDDEKLKEIVSTEYGKPLYEMFKAAGFDFYRIDPNLFAPAVVSVNNIRTGQTFRSGYVNASVLKETMGVVAV
jgi:methenyltetrahydromethanopterin cyclohydrolase